MAPEDLACRLVERDPPLVIDARAALDYCHGDLPDAHHVSVHTLDDTLPSLEQAPKVTAQAVRETAQRSARRCNCLRPEGSSAHQLAGGIDRWRRRWLPVVRGDTT